MVKLLDPGFYWYHPNENDKIYLPPREWHVVKITELGTVHVFGMVEAHNRDFFYGVFSGPMHRPLAKTDDYMVNFNDISNQLITSVRGGYIPWGELHARRPIVLAGETYRVKGIECGFNMAGEMYANVTVFRVNEDKPVSH